MNGGVTPPTCRKKEPSRSARREQLFQGTECLYYAELSTEKADNSAKKSIEKCPLMCYTVSVSKQV